MEFLNFEIPCCRAGTVSTLEIMARLVRDCLRKPIVRQKALEILGGGVSDRAQYADAVRIYIRRFVAIVDEPDEMLHKPCWMLSEIDRAGVVYGDCDDTAMLAASLMLGIGVPSRFKAIFRQPDGSYGHVFAEWSNGEKGWTALDPTIGFYPVYPGDFLIQEI